MQPVAQGGIPEVSITLHGKISLTHLSSAPTGPTTPTSEMQEITVSVIGNYLLSVMGLPYSV